MNYSARLKNAMYERGVSQNELAGLVGVGKSSVSQWVNGVCVPRPYVMEKVADVLKYPIEYFEQETEPVTVRRKKILPADVAKLLGVSTQAVRKALQDGKAPYGYAIKEASKYSYHIYPKKVRELIGEI